MRISNIKNERIALYTVCDGAVKWKLQEISDITSLHGECGSM